MNKKILNLAIPNIISNISIPLLGIVDMALMGHLESDVYIGAIALGSLIFNFIYWGLGFLRMGTSGFTAQAWGRRDLPETILVFSRAAFIPLGCPSFIYYKTSTTRGPLISKDYINKVLICQML